MDSIDPARAVVLALHFQNDIAHERGKMGFGSGAKRANVVDAATRLLDGARAAGVALVHGRVAYRPDYAETFDNCKLFRRVVGERALVEGEWGSQFVDEIQPRDGELVFTHRRVNPFYGSMLQELLDKRGAETVIVCGVATNYVVEHAARHASDVGYRTIVAADACSSSSDEAHTASLRAMDLIAEIERVDDVLRAFATPVPT